MGKAVAWERILAMVKKIVIDSFAGQQARIYLFGS